MKLTKLSAISAALCICLVMAGCEVASSKDKSDKESTAETVATEEAVTTTAIKINVGKEDLGERSGLTLPEAPEGTPAPSGNDVEDLSTFDKLQEISEADFNSGLVQVGGDLFHTGGFYTVDQFIRKFGNKYDLSSIDPEKRTEPNEWLHPTVTSSSISAIQLRISIMSAANEDGSRSRLGDAIVVDVKGSLAVPEDLPLDEIPVDELPLDEIPLDELSVDKYPWLKSITGPDGTPDPKAVKNILQLAKLAEGMPLKDVTWLPKYPRADGTTANGDNILDMLKGMGLQQVTYDQAMNELDTQSDIYWCENGTDKLKGFRLTGKDKNILGNYPVYIYEFENDSDTGKGEISFAAACDSSTYVIKRMNN